jgi:ribosomal protein S4E
MKQISEIADFRQIFVDAAQNTRQYNKTSENIYKPDNARFKLVVWFKNGKTRYFYSYDNKQTKQGVHIDEYEGLMKLCRFVNKIKGEYKNAIIYTHLEQNKTVENDFNFEVAKWDIYNNLKTNKIVSFLTNEKNTFMNLKNCQLYGSQKIK